VGLPRLLVPQKIADPLQYRVGFILVNAEKLIELACEIGETPGIMVEDRDVAAGHVGDTDVMPLFDQADDRPAHANDVVGGVGTEYQNRLGLSLRSVGGALRTGRLRADSADHFVEDASAKAVGRPMLA